jgi:hypothetical protein
MRERNVSVLSAEKTAVHESAQSLTLTENIAICP